MIIIARRNVDGAGLIQWYASQTNLMQGWYREIVLTCTDTRSPDPIHFDSSGEMDELRDRISDLEDEIEEKEEIEGTEPSVAIRIPRSASGFNSR